MTDPLPPRRPVKRDAEINPDMDMARSIQGLQPAVPKESIPKAVINLLPDLTAADDREEDIKRAYRAHNLPNPEMYDVEMPPLPEMHGSGKYRMAKDVTREQRLEILRSSSTSDMTKLILPSIRSLDIIHPETYEDLVPESESVKSYSRPRTPAPALEYIDRRAGAIVQRGFSPSPFSSAGSTWVESRRKGSSISSTSTNESKLSRQYSAVSDQESPLQTISETEGKQPAKKEKACTFEAGGDPESAIASDDEDWEVFDMFSPRTAADMDKKRPPARAVMNLNRYRKDSDEAVKKPRDNLHRRMTRPGYRRTSSKKPDSGPIEEPPFGQSLAVDIPISPRTKELADFGSIWQTMQTKTGSIFERDTILQQQAMCLSDSDETACDESEPYEDVIDGGEADDLPGDLDACTKAFGRLNTHGADTASVESTATIKNAVLSGRPRLPVVRDRSTTIIHRPPPASKQEVEKEQAMPQTAF